MAYKAPILKPSIYFYDKNYSPNGGFNLDKWLHEQLIGLELIPDDEECCKTNNLHIKGGFIFKERNLQGFNFNKWLYITLDKLQTVDFNLEDVVCCPTKDIKIQHSEIFYTNEPYTGKDLQLWLKNKLDFYGINYDDPCCP